MIDVGHLFPGSANGVYLNTASMALGNQPAADALARSIEEWRNGSFDWVAAERIAEDLRTRVAALLAVSAEDVAFVTGASGGAATVAAQLPAASPGANIVLPARDFASNFLPWLLLRERGYEIRMVEDAGGELPPGAFATHVDAGTAVIATSLVQSATGFKVDLDALKTVAHDAGAWLAIDASQAFGCVAIDANGIDALFSCSHKWTLGIRGIGHLYVSPDLRDAFRPITPGWSATARPMENFYGPTMELSQTATKLDASTPWFNPIADIEGIRIIDDIGIGTIEAHNTALIDHLEEGGVVVPFRREDRSPIVSIGLRDTDATLRALDDQDIVASARAGNLRISVHLYNTREDLDRLTRAIH